MACGADAPQNRHAVGNDGRRSIQCFPEVDVAQRESRCVRIGDANVAPRPAPDHFQNQTYGFVKIQRRYERT
jgi:hypothetical protein